MTLILVEDEKIAIKKIDQLMETYCKGCLLKRIIEDQGKHQAHQYCISECSIGIRIKQLETNFNKEDIMEIVRVEPTPSPNTMKIIIIQERG